MKLSEQIKLCENDSRFIRKLGLFESLADEELMSNNMNITTATLLLVDKAFQIDMVSLKKASHIWINTHSLLQAKTFRILNEKTLKSSVSLPKYFIRNEKSIEDYNNLDLIENEGNNLSWHDLVETELKTPLNFIDGPLWRMKILKINLNADNNKYALIFTISHSISDGRNCFSIVNQFLSILEKVVNADEKSLTKKDLQEIPSINSSDFLIEKFKMEGKLKINRMDLIESCQLWGKLVNRVTAKSGHKLNGVNGRVEYFLLEKFKLDKLFQKMKSNAASAKLTSLLIIVICIAFKRTCLNHRLNDIPLEDYVIAVPVCLRSKLNIGNLNMGCNVGICHSLVKFGKKKSKEIKMSTLKSYILLFLRFIYFHALSLILLVLCVFVKRASKLEAKLIEKTRTIKKGKKLFEVNFEDDREEFWSLVEENSKKLHKIVKSNCELDVPKKEIQILDIFLKNNFNFSTFNLVNFCVSNLGKLENTVIKDKCISIIECYVCQPCVEKRFSPPLHFGISTVEGNLCCAISYSEKIYSIEFISDLKLLILKLIDDVIQ